MKVLGGFAAFGLAVYAFVIFVSLMANLNSTEFNQHNNSEVIEKGYGLIAEKEYPLEYGSRVEGSGGEASVSSGFFSASAHVLFQPASALSVTFHYQGKSYILELPMEKITFQQRKGPETISFKIGGKRDGKRGSIYFNWVFRRDKLPLRKQEWFQDTVKTTSLGEYLNSGPFQMATITLKPKSYQKILNG